MSRRAHGSPHPERPHWHWDSVWCNWKRPHPPTAPYGLVVGVGDDDLAEIDKADAMYPLPTPTGDAP